MECGFKRHAAQTERIEANSLRFNAFGRYVRANGSAQWPSKCFLHRRWAFRYDARLEAPMYQAIQDQPVSESATETRLWLAVVTDAVQDWMHGPLRARREAEQYLFHDDRDFPELCERAGLNASLLRTKLIRARDRAA
jgi:hypothetical protein